MQLSHMRRHQLFIHSLREVGRIVRPGTVVISNTSCIPIDEMANWLERPEELVGVHFMNPTYLIKAVEMIRGPRTDLSKDVKEKYNLAVEKPDVVERLKTMVLDWRKSMPAEHVSVNAQGPRVDVQDDGG